MNSILIHNGTIITMDGQRRVIEQGSVAIQNDRIVAVGKKDDVGPFSADKAIDASGCVVLPGLINCHIHTSMTIQRGLGENVPLTERLKKVVNPIDAGLTKEETYYSTLLGCVELIKSGTTCCNDIFSGKHPDETIQALTDAGLRAEVGKKLMDTGDIGSALFQDAKTGLAECDNLIRRWHESSKGRIKYRLCPEWVPACSDELLSAIAELSRKRSVGIHTHANCDWDLLQDVRKRTGMTEIEYMDSLGLTGPQSVFAHCVYLTEKEMDILARTNTRVAYSPVIPAKTGAGIAPIAALIKRGVTVGLGTDSAGLNTNQDLLEEMRIAGILQRGSFLDPTVLPTQKLLEMTTVDAAKTLMNSEIGSIEVGKKADIAVIDFRKPHLRPNHTRIVSHLVWAAYASDVITTIVDGQVLMENRILQKLDEQSILEKVDRLAEQLLERVGYHENTTWNWE